MFRRKSDPRAWVFGSLHRIMPPEHRGTAIHDGMELRAVGVDSLGLMVLMAEFCDQHDVRMETVDISGEQLRTIGDLVRVATGIAKGTRAQ